MARCIVVGNACVDIYLPSHKAPPPGRLVHIPAIDLQIGGNGANTAITLGRLGVSAAVAGVLGDDAFGRHIHHHLREERVDVARLKLLMGRTSPTSLVYNDPSGERSFAHHAGTNEQFQVPEEAINAPCRVFHFAAPELLPGIWPNRCLDVARRLKAAGRTISLDTFVGSRRTSSSEPPKEYATLLKLVDMAFPNEEEARYISGKTDLGEVIRYFRNQGVKTVAIKRGEKGALLSANGGIHEVKAASVRAVDTCGAGDNFAAGYIAGYLEGLPPLECARLGCTLGTLCVGFRGALRGTSDRRRLEKVLASFDFRLQSSKVLG